MNFYIIYLVTFTSLVSCSSFIYTETNNQTNKNDISFVGDNIRNDFLFDMKCTLISIKISDYEKLSFPLNGNYSTLKFSDNGSYSGKAICNTFYGKYILERNNIRFKNTMMTRMNCDNKTETLITNTLNEINNYTIDDKKLFLKRNTEILMIYQLN